MSAGKLEELDFRPRRPLVMLIVFLVFYVLIFGTVLFVFGIRDISGGLSLATWIELIFIVGNYVLVGSLLLYYFVFGPYRFKFKEDGVHVHKLLGWRLFAWRDVQKAVLASSRSGIDLVLNYGSWRTVTIPMSFFGRNKKLYEEIRYRLPVGIVAAERTVAMLRDE